MTAIPKKFTYILAPNCKILPEDAVLSLGSIFSSPLEPEETVLNETARIPIPLGKTKIRTMSDWRTTVGKLRQHKLTIWASFLQFLIGLGFNIDGFYKNDKEDVFKFEKLETRTYGANITSKRNKGWGAGGEVSLDETAMGAPVSAGPKVENSVDRTRETEIGKIEVLVFAYRLSRIIMMKEGKSKAESYTDGALFGVGEEREGEWEERYDWAAAEFEVDGGEEEYQGLDEVVVDDKREGEYAVLKSLGNFGTTPDHCTIVSSGVSFLPPVNNF
ncbi:uncharacterized protein PAC_04281 [Phialocephala subalpina]|uniref:Uncharacterized protein n=1 Tax=Phialocephala subalpina TaxID=576137 RepID=A0A1L7WNP4_9HELO|nr:uncharacterized protein PAC_04281 [Phialocephala subalpina]